VGVCVLQIVSVMNNVISESVQTETCTLSVFSSRALSIVTKEACCISRNCSFISLQLQTEMAHVRGSFTVRVYVVKLFLVQRV
jgi:hypothetical protein